MLVITVDILRVLPVSERAKERIEEIDLSDFSALEQVVEYIKESECRFENILELNDFLIYNTYIDELIGDEN